MRKTAFEIPVVVAVVVAVAVVAVAVVAAAAVVVVDYFLRLSKLSRLLHRVFRHSAYYILDDSLFRCV